MICEGDAKEICGGPSVSCYRSSTALETLTASPDQALTVYRLTRATSAHRKRNQAQHSLVVRLSPSFLVFSRAQYLLKRVVGSVTVY